VSDAIVATGLTKRYGETLALAELDLVVRTGEVYGFLGPNGSGKTTTIRCLLGLHRPTAGSAALFGVDAWRDAVRAHRRVAYVAGEPSLWPQLTTEETLDFLAQVRGGVDVEYRGVLIDRFQVEPTKKVRALSKGNRQKIQLVHAFSTRADLLILDEPTSGLDPLMEVAFRDTVAEAKERSQAVFLSSHILSEVEALCDRVGILRAGRLVDEGTLSELRHLRAQTIEVVFAGTVPDLGPVDGAVAVPVGDNTVRFEVNGPVGPILDRIAGHDVVAISAREPSLEEIFLHHYEPDSAERNGNSPKISVND